MTYINNVRRSAWSLALLVVSTSLTGCASFDGLPQPVVSVSALTQVVAKYPVDTSLQKFFDETDETKQKYHRDKIIGIYMAAIDARYLEFRRLLSRQAKGSNFGLDLAVLGLSGGASIAGERTANILSAGSAALTGTRASISKQLYFEQTLPAMLGNMDAARTEVRGQILRRMQQPANEYTLPMAFSDLALYEGSAAIDKAIQKVNTDAGVRDDAAQAKLAKTIDYVAGVPTEATIDLRLALRKSLGAIADDQSRASAVATAIGAAPKTTAGETINEIRILFNQKGDAAMLAKIDAAIAASAPTPPAPTPGNL